MSRGQHYKSQGKKGLFDEQHAFELLSAIVNPLATVSKVVDFNMFRPTLEKELLNSDKKTMQGPNPLMW